MGLTVGGGDAAILSCGSIAPLVGRRARIVAARLDIYRPRHALRREWTDGAFPVLDPTGFYSTSGACSVSPFTTMVSERPPRVVSLRWPHRRTHRAPAGTAIICTVAGKAVSAL